MGMENEYDGLREQLKSYMGENDLTIAEVAGLLDRYPLTIWNFLRKGTVPHFATAARIKKLVSMKNAVKGKRGTE